jgi:hypothetical protein
MSHPNAYGMRSLGAGSRIELIDYARASKRSEPAGVDGITAVVFDQVPSDQFWLVDRVVVTSDSTSDTLCALYEDVPTDPSKILDVTSAGNLDVADNSSPVTVPGSTSLYVQWIDCTPGSRATCRIAYRVMRRH